MKYLILPILLMVLCFSGFTSQVQANGLPLMSLEHGGTIDIKGSNEFDVIVCNDFEVELWVRDLHHSLFIYKLIVSVTWDPELMELRNVELHLPSDWRISDGPFERANSWFIHVEGEILASNRKWMTFTFHCKGEGSSQINIPELDPVNSAFVGPDDGSYVVTTKLKAAVTQFDATVGGLVTPANKLAILTPYIALAGLIIAVSTVYVVKRRRD